MVKIKQLSVERQVLLAFSAIGLLVVAIGGLLIFSPQSVQQNISKQHSIASSEMMGQMQPNGLRGISTIGMVVDVLAGISLVITAGAGFFIARTARRLEEDNRLFQIQIAEQKEMQESLQLLGSAITQSKDAILITEAELDAPGPKIVFVNPAFTKMTGYTADEALGKTPRILQGPRTDKAVLNRLLKNLHEGEVFEGETVNYRKNGEELEIEWQIAPIRNAAGTITNFVGIQRDIKERKTHEARLFQSQKMETIGRLAGGFAHEFNSIMTAIIGQSEMILGDLSQGTPAVNRAMEIRHAADRAAILTRQLLAYGRRQILQPEILDLNKILIEMTETLQHLMGKEVEVQIIPNPELKAVKIDPGQMEQVLLNMAINAADAMPNGGKFLLETSNVTLDEAYVCPFAGLKSGDYVMLAISDTGECSSRFFPRKGWARGQVWDCPPAMASSGKATDTLTFTANLPEAPLSRFICLKSSSRRKPPRRALNRGLYLEERKPFFWPRMTPPC
jgi:PAS domain S-box-containing protein